MKKAHTLSLFALAGIAAAGLAGCGEAYDSATYSPEVQIEPAHNFLGILKTSPGSYVAHDPDTVPLSTRDISATRLYSGTRVELFWGAITLTDY